MPTKKVFEEADERGEEAVELEEAALEGSAVDADEFGSEDDDSFDEPDDEAIEDGAPDPEESHFQSLDSLFEDPEESSDGGPGSQLVTQPTKATRADLYRSIGVRDGIEAMMAESAMSMFDVAQDSLNRAMESDDFSVREQNFKIALDANGMTMKFAKAIGDYRRSQQPKTVHRSLSFG